MSEKRKDTNNRILRDGESMRPNGTYCYRYTDPITGKRPCVYAKTLDELREKEEKIKEAQVYGLNYQDGNMTVKELCEKYASLHTNIQESSKLKYKYSYNMVAGDAFGEKKISTIREIDAKTFLKGLSPKYAFITINSLRAYLFSVFKFAVKNEMVRVNPFDFKLVSIIPDDTVKRDALSDQNLNLYMDFVKENNKNLWLFTGVSVETGTRVSELCALTVDDVNFDTKMMNIDKQIACNTISGNKRYLKEPKTKTSIRLVPLSDQAIGYLKAAIELNEERRTQCQSVDGVSNFIFVTTKRLPYVESHINKEYSRMWSKFIKENPDANFSKVTPHILRHTFISNLYKLGVDPMSVAKIAGHASPNMTLSVYTHTDSEWNFSQFFKAMEKREKDRP